MTDPLQHALIDLEAARQTGLLIQARNEIAALNAINQERAKEIAELKAANNAIVRADNWQVDEQNAGFDAAQNGTPRGIGELQYRAQYPDRPLYDVYDIGYSMGILAMYDVLPEDVISQLADAKREVARLTECVKALEAESLPDEATENEWQRVTKGGKR